MLDETKGTLANAVGQAKETAGSVTGDTVAQFAGKAQQLASQAQKNYGETLDRVRDMTTQKPVAALAVVGAIGVVIGALLARN